VGLGFAGRIVGNAFSEFFPDLGKHLFKTSSSPEGVPQRPEGAPGENSGARLP